MKIINIISFSIVFLCIFVLGGSAEVPEASFEVSPIFCDNIIFQQNSPIRIWGTSVIEGNKITVVLGDSVGETTVKNGEWEMELAERCYSSTPGVLEIYDEYGTYVSFNNIMIGDVWWVLGQSNVEYTSAASGSFNAFANRITEEENICVVNLKKNSFKKNNVRWQKFSKNSIYSSSALGTFFVKNISDYTNNEIPMGFISMGYGGMSIDKFMKKGEIYGDVISEIERMPIKGLIWYQGESDADKYWMYADKLKKLISDLREKKNMLFPVYSIELPPCFPDYNDKNRQYEDFGLVRGESGSLTLDTYRFYVCPTSDLWKDKAYQNNIHPDNKSVIAERLALMVVSKEYGFGLEDMYFGPTVSEIKYQNPEKTSVSIEFEHTGDGIFGDIRGFELIDADYNRIEDIFFKITDKNKILLSADRAIYIVRYGTKTDSVFPENKNLSSSYNIPAAAFSCSLTKPDKKPIIKYLILTVGILVFIDFFILFALKKAENR